MKLQVSVQENYFFSFGENKLIALFVVENACELEGRVFTLEENLVFTIHWCYVYGLFIVHVDCSVFGCFCMTKYLCRSLVVTHLCRCVVKTPIGTKQHIHFANPRKGSCQRLLLLGAWLRCGAPH